MTPMGLSGQYVQQKMFVEAIQIIRDHYRNNPQSRIAIIYRKGLENLQHNIFRYLSAEMCCYDIIRENKISVLTVERAKGLEFEHVLVIENKMTPNEKYVSFTRSLETLTVTELL